MKNLKKLAALILSLMLVLSLVPVTAEEEEPELGSITINTVSEGTTYAIYRLLDLESYNLETGAYSYKVSAKWASFFASADCQPYFSVDSSNYATWQGGDAAETAAAFAKLALAYAEENGIAPEKSNENDGEFVVTEGAGVFSELPLGYYLVDSSMGALCGLTTTNPDASVNAKNGQPTIDKQVKEDLTNQWGDVNTADIGQVIEFRVTVNVHPGAQNFVLHDDMSAGLTFQQFKKDAEGHDTTESLVKVERIDSSVGTETIVVDPSLYTLVLDSECGDENCDFEIKFAKELVDLLDTNDKLMVYYSAMVNRDAVVGGVNDGVTEANPNEAWLEFGEDHYTTHDQTKTFSFGIDIIKTDSQNKLLDGAAFRIYDAAEGGNEVKVVLMDDQVSYRRARADEDGVDIVVANGRVRVVGFDNGTYYLDEVTTPEGYNQLAGRQAFTISDGNLDATFNGDIYSSGSGVHVVNKSGTMLPETGGIGTTLFYVIGGALVFAAVVLLITKKRMSNAE